MPSPRLTPRTARFAALQALAGALGVIALYLLGLFITRANEMGDTGGIDDVNMMICWIAFTGIAIALVYVHVNFARQLFGESKGVQRGVKSW
jgi:hypothetical protein